MGLIILDEVTTCFGGPPETKLYATFRGGYELKKQDSKRYVRATLEMRKVDDASKPCIHIEPYNIVITEEEYNSNIMVLLYNKVKEKYPNSQDN